jgi:hypothetical protein
MTVDEQWRSFSRHHKAMEIELEAYRIWAKMAGEYFGKFSDLFPGMIIEMPEVPPKTPKWKGETYRDSNGKFPNDIMEHCDWLSIEDFDAK